MAESGLLGLGYLPGTPLAEEARRLIVTRLEAVRGNIGRSQALADDALSLARRATTSDLPLLERDLGGLASELGRGLRNTVVTRSLVRDLIGGR